MELHMISTKDNPFSPVTDYDDWLAFDEAKGYYSNSLLARVVYSSDELSDADRAQAIEDGIEEIVSENVSGVHIKVNAGSLAFAFEEVSDNTDTTNSSAA